MYAHRRYYVKQWEHESEDERYSVQVTRGGKPVPGLQPDRISAIEEQVMYWRKANHIHAWFVDNVQGGQDSNDGRTYYVELEQLGELLDICETVIEASMLVDGAVYNGTVYNQEHPNGLVQRTAGKVIEDPTVARRLLPAREGFFFGSYEYDQYYLDDVYATWDWAKRMLKESDDGVPGDLHYSSSW